MVVLPKVLSGTALTQVRGVTSPLILRSRSTLEAELLGRQWVGYG